MILFDPADPPPDAWPEGTAIERGYIEGVGRLGPAGMVSNVATTWRAIRVDDHLLPVTIDDGDDRTASYVTRPSAAYVDYARREIELVGMGRRGRWLGAALSPIGLLLRAAGIDRIVHLDNWLLSTNLHGRWEGQAAPAMRAMLAARYPGHILAVRSVDDWSSPTLLAALRNDGWTLVPSRQVWVTDDLARDWMPRNAFGNDRRLVARSGLAIDTLGTMENADAVAIADLYRQLYVGKYSRLNPVFTAAFVATTHASGLIRYRVARAGDGTIRAVAGMLTRAGIMTPAVVGYDLSRPRDEGLYRIASWMFADAAMAAGRRLHGSAGAAHFKRLRGARGVIEYWAMDARHLPPPARAGVAMLAATLERWVVPMMRRRGW